MWGARESSGPFTVKAIQDRIAREADDERAGRVLIESHFAPTERLTIDQAHTALQQHRVCDRQTCPKKAAAFNLLVAAGRIRADRRVGY